jgi:DNA-binding transcriptional regulator of glucitol operon
VRRLLISPRWLVGHVLVAACFVAFLWLGWWQWGRAHEAGGTGQNLGYALQWPLFAGFLLYGWSRVLRIEAAKARAADEPEPEPEPPKPRLVVPKYQPPAIDDGEPDEELAAYNRRLAALHEQDQHLREPREQTS